MINNQLDNQAFSLIMVILIISSILTGTLIIGEIIIRHSRVVKGVEISEMAFFAAESAMEKASYQIIKDYTSISGYSLSGSLDNAAAYSVDTVAATTADDPWNVTLAAGESFQINLDLNGAAYPTSLLIAKDGVGTDEPSDLIIYQCTTSGSPPSCSSGYTSTFTVSFPATLSLISVPTYFYKIRINNTGSSSETYVLTPTGADLPDGVDISVSGTSSGYERKVKSSFPKWQNFGV